MKHCEHNMKHYTIYFQPDSSLTNCFYIFRLKPSIPVIVQIAELAQGALASILLLVHWQIFSQEITGRIIIRHSTTLLL